MVLVKVMKAVGEKNAEVASAIRNELAGKGITAINLISSPGSGKTFLLEETIKRLGSDISSAVIVGDPFGTADGERIEAAGGMAFQLNTEGSCHLTAPMIKAALDEMNKDGLRLLFIENIGNLICPAAWDLGENRRVTLLSVTEGRDKVAKYRKAFFIADVVVLSKIDLAGLCEFDLDEAEKDVHDINPRAKVIRLSAKTGKGLEEWLGWLRSEVIR